MVDRRILLVGSCKGVEDTFTPQRVKGLMQRLARTLGPESPYAFSSIEEKGAPPNLYYNPLRSPLLAVFEGLTEINPDTELLIYFVGHSRTLGKSDLELFLGEKKNGDESNLNVQQLLSEAEAAGFKRIFLVIDGCHASNCTTAVNTSNVEVFAIYSSDGYAYNGNFTEAFIRAVEPKVQRSDQRIDRRRGGITLNKLFEVSRLHLRNAISQGAPKQAPGAVGGYGDALLLETPPLMADRFNPFASSQSVYGRLKTILNIIDRDHPNEDELFGKCKLAGGFLLRRSKHGNNASYLSRERLHDYTDFLIDAKLVVKPSGRYQLTELGQDALNVEKFNKCLLGAISENVFPVGLTFDDIDESIKQLLDDLIPPTPSKIEERLQIISEKPIKITSKLRFAFQVLPATGRFLKGSADALFLAER